MKFTDALTALIDDEYARTSKYYQDFPIGEPRTRDEVAVGDRNVRIASEVFGEGGLTDEFYDDIDQLDFGIFYNCREYGLTVTVGDWTFAAYEHRNSDEICIEGCPTAEVKPYGPYGGKDKYDVLFAARWKQYHDAARAVTAAARYVLFNPETTREALRKHIEEQVAFQAA